MEMMMNVALAGELLPGDIDFTRRTKFDDRRPEHGTIEADHCQRLHVALSVVIGGIVQDNVGQPDVSTGYPELLQPAKIIGIPLEEGILPLLDQAEKTSPSCCSEMLPSSPDPAKCSWSKSDSVHPTHRQ